MGKLPGVVLLALLTSTAAFAATNAWAEGYGHHNRGGQGMGYMRGMDDDDMERRGMGYGRGGWMMGGGMMMERYRMIDANDDGRISDDEAAAQRESVFLAMDEDDDGELTEEEYMAVRMGPGQGRNAERRKQREEAKRARFSPMDTDKSGTVSKVEFMAEGQARFVAADADKDGVVTPWEFRAHRD